MKQLLARIGTWVGLLAFFGLCIVILVVAAWPFWLGLAALKYIFF